MTTRLEHVNFTVSDTDKTAKWMADVFGWHIRWEGDAIAGGHSKHVGSDTQYVAIYTPPGGPAKAGDKRLSEIANLNHIAVVVDDLDATEAAVDAKGFPTSNHADYEPGRRFYFHDHDGIEFEVVQYD